MITFDPLTTDFMLQRASRIEARLRYALVDKAGFDLNEVRPGLTLEGYRDLFEKNGILIDHVAAAQGDIRTRLETYIVRKHGEVVDQFQVDFYGIIKEKE